MFKIIKSRIFKVKNNDRLEIKRKAYTLLNNNIDINMLHSLEDRNVYEEIERSIFGSLFPLIKYKFANYCFFDVNFDSFMKSFCYKDGPQYSEAVNMEKIFINIVNSFKTNRMKNLSGKSNIYSPDIFLSPDSNNIDFNKFKSYVYARTKAYVRFLESYNRLEKFNKYNKGNFEKVLASNSNIYFSSFIYCNSSELSRFQRRGEKIERLLDELICIIFANYILKTRKIRLSLEVLQKDSELKKSCYRLWDYFFNVEEPFAYWEVYYQQFLKIIDAIRNNNSLKKKVDGIVQAEFKMNFDELFENFMTKDNGIIDLSYWHIIAKYDRVFDRIEKILPVKKGNNTSDNKKIYESNKMDKINYIIFLSNKLGIGLSQQSIDYLINTPNNDEYLNYLISSYQDDINLQGDINYRRENVKLLVAGYHNNFATKYNQYRKRTGN